MSDKPPQTLEEWRDSQPEPNGPLDPDDWARDAFAAGVASQQAELNGLASLVNALQDKVDRLTVQVDVDASSLNYVMHGELELKAQLAEKDREIERLNRVHEDEYDALKSYHEAVVEAAREWNEARKAINDRSHPNHLKWSRATMEVLPLVEALDAALAALEEKQVGSISWREAWPDHPDRRSTAWATIETDDSLWDFPIEPSDFPTRPPDVLPPVVAHKHGDGHWCEERICAHDPNVRSYQCFACEMASYDREEERRERGSGFWSEEVTYLDSRRERIAQDMSHIMEMVALLIDAQQHGDWANFVDRTGELVNWSKRAGREARHLRDAQ